MAKVVGSAFEPSAFEPSALGPAERIGPYRLQGRLGAGGMGETWRAWDERLARWVALKRIHPKAADDETARERLRREARAAARLNHPAVVQIYDLIETEEGDDILVLELVPGETLAARLRREGPWPPERTMALGREIAAGLAAAHAAGLVHRDLKPANVMVTPDGHAKILDLGLARRFEGDDDEPSLTADGHVLGTLSAMSPEQAAGLAVDGRSDLFSFGTLLYETLSGRSPFAAESPLATLQKIGSASPEPLARIDPSIPAELSRLVERLLEKEPNHRPQSADRVAAVLEGLSRQTTASTVLPVDDDLTPSDSTMAFPSLPWPSLPSVPPAPPPRRRRKRLVLWGAIAGLALALAAGAVYYWYRWSGAPTYVAIPAPELPAGAGPVERDFATALREALLEDVTAGPGLLPLEPGQVDAVAGPLRAVARATAADEMLSSRLECPGELCSVTLRRVRGADGTVIQMVSFPVPLDSPGLLAQTVPGILERLWPDLSWRHAARAQVRPEDYRRYLEIHKAVDRSTDSRAIAAWIDELTVIAERSPGFVSAALLGASTASSRFQTTRDPRDLERALKLLDLARKAAPTDPRPLIVLFDVMLRSEQPARAQEALQQLQELQPGNADLLVLEGRLAERQGRIAEALELMRRRVRQRPTWYGFLQLAELELRSGRDAAARQHLTEVLARHPNHTTARSLLAQTELQSGSVERAAALYEQLVRRSPGFEEVTNLGTAYLLLGRMAEAEDRFRRALAISPDQPYALLNLADVLTLLGRPEEGAALYRRAIARIDQDPARDDWQMRSVRAQALAHLGRSRDAVVDAQQVLVRAAENPQALYEVALVYTILGERLSARVSAENALARGMTPRWFRFPWFAPLLSDAEFSAKLTAAEARLQAS